MHLGVGVGWMREEFAAVGIERRRRGEISDETLRRFEEWFSQDEAVANGQSFLFKPRPPKPPIYVGGAGAAALRRCVRFGDAWLPMTSDLDKLGPAMSELGALAATAGRERPKVVPIVPLPTKESQQAVDVAGALRDIGCSGLIHGFRYDDASTFSDEAGRLAEVSAALN
jgi:alkanesulfonate monooxygenase SsuD/methylene tetrahydromethanopterin reductase-like flavin-dependent oxidoreductase (luciferase family)